MSAMKVEFVGFATRQERVSYVARRYAEYLNGSVLDAGCDRALLRELLPSCSYTGIDVTANADIKLDLDKLVSLPLEDGAFDCVVCTDVLEHLENLHAIFAELIRVSRRYVILSLPNNWANARRPIERGKGSVGHYGLPADPPADRHRWFFSLEEALRFLRDRERVLPFSIREVHAVEKPRPVLVRAARRLRYPSQMRYLNRYAGSLWAVLEKKGKQFAPMGPARPGQGKLGAAPW